MRPLRRLLCAALLGAAASAWATPAAPVAGLDYTVLPTAQNTDAGRKIEVIAFFAYYCPHCNAFEPLLTAWAARQGEAIAYRRVHVPRDASVAPQQRLYYTLEALGLLGQYHEQVFAAMHTQRVRLASDEQVFDWITRAGIDRAAFIAAYRSFGVQQRVRRADALAQAYGIARWPQVAIDGRFLTSPSQVGEHNPDLHSEAEQQQAALRVMDHLVAKAKAERP